MKAPASGQCLLLAKHSRLNTVVTSIKTAPNVSLTFSFDSRLYSGSIFVWIKISYRNHGGVGGLGRLKFRIVKNAKLQFGRVHDV